MSDASPAWLHAASLQHFFALVASHGGQARAVGGCVRDFLLGRSGGDIDLCTTLEPEAMLKLCAQHGIKAVPTGIAHGTITLVLEGRGVEVTTLRRDVATDGRHATVAFTDRFEEDAARRDFTINALYMDARGTLYDFFGGRDDLQQNTLRFIGDARQRIHEDGLRLLRYFRFLAVLGWQAREEALAACRENVGMLEALSGERIQQEMKRLLSAADPSHSLAHMMDNDLPAHLATGPWELSRLPRLLALERVHAVPPQAWRRLYAIAPHMEVAQIVLRWKLSNTDKKTLEALGQGISLNASAVKEALRHHPREHVIDRILLAATKDSDAEISALIALARSYDVPVFPVTARDLMARGWQEGAALGQALKALEQRWVASEYRLDKTALLDSL